MAALRCPACGLTWDQRGNLTGHCSACHRTFAGIRAFDDHQLIDHGKVICRDPGLRRKKSGSAMWRAVVDGCGALVWCSPDLYPIELRRR